jgi:hypothetical protein
MHRPFVCGFGFAKADPRGPRGRGGVATDKGSEVADFFGGPRKRWNQNRDGLALGWREGSALSHRRLDAKV